MYMKQKMNELECPHCFKIGKYKQYSILDWYTGEHIILVCECGTQHTTKKDFKNKKRDFRKTIRTFDEEITLGWANDL